VLRLRFIADFEERVERFAEREWIDPDMARSLIRRSDHQRGGFIHFYFDRDWRQPNNYDMIFNTSRLSESTIIDCIVAAVKEPSLKEADKASVAVIDSTIMVKKIETALLSAPSLEDYRPFTITFEKGVATLGGYIVSETQKNSAINIVRSLKGVSTVKDDIQVVNYKAYKDKI